MRRQQLAVLIGSLCLLMGAHSAPAREAAQAAASSDAGTAIVRVVTEPELPEGATFVFTGVPAGEVVLTDDGQGALTADGVAVGSHVAKLSEIDPQAAAAGYALTEIRCDDQDSAGPSLGKLDNDAAIFRIEASEAVTCEFVLEKRTVGAVRTGADCICPEEGRWNAQNLEGSMDCRGAFVLNRKLKPVKDNGIILVMKDDCSQLFGDSATRKEEDTLMTRVDDCTYEGVFESEEENVDMVIDVVWTIESRERITGEMSSSTSQMGVTCDFYRPFELTFDEPLSDKEYEKWEQRIRKKMSRMK
jgi:hypothetical protein